MVQRREVRDRYRPGLYANPACGSEWYPHEMYLARSKINQHQVCKYGQVDKFGYKEFIPMFSEARSK